MSNQIVGVKCGRCGTPLTDPESIKRGYGPECDALLRGGKGFALMHRDGRLTCPKCGGNIIRGRCRACNVTYTRYVEGKI